MRTNSLLSLASAAVQLPPAPVAVAEERLSDAVLGVLTAAALGDLKKGLLLPRAYPVKDMSAAQCAELITASRSKVKEDGQYCNAGAVIEARPVGAVNLPVNPAPDASSGAVDEVGIRHHQHRRLLVAVLVNIVVIEFNSGAVAAPCRRRHGDPRLRVCCNSWAERLLPADREPKSLEACSRRSGTRLSMQSRGRRDCRQLPGTG